MSMLSMKKCYKLEDDPQFCSRVQRKLLVYAVNLSRLSTAPLTRYNYYAVHSFLQMASFWGGYCEIAPNGSFMKGMV